MHWQNQYPGQVYRFTPSAGLRLGFAHESKASGNLVPAFAVCRDRGRCSVGGGWRILAAAAFVCRWELRDESGCLCLGRDGSGHARGASLTGRPDIIRLGAAGLAFTNPPNGNLRTRLFALVPAGSRVPSGVGANRRAAEPVAFWRSYPSHCGLCVVPSN